MPSGPPAHRGQRGVVERDREGPARRVVEGDRRLGRPAQAQHPRSLPARLERGGRWREDHVDRHEDEDERDPGRQHDPWFDRRDECGGRDEQDREGQPAAEVHD